MSDRLALIEQMIAKGSTDPFHFYARAMELRQQDTVWARSYDATHPRRAEIARELAEIDADRARAIGLVEDVYPDEEFGAQARALAGAIAANPPAVTQGIKNVLNYCADKSNKDGEQYVALWNSAFLPSKDLMEAMTAYAQGRAPEFTGE